MKNFWLLTNLYLPQKKKVQGFPSNENWNSGSKLSFLFPMARSKVTAGFPRVKVGISDIPLLVTVIPPDSSVGTLVSPAFCAKASEGGNSSAKMSIAIGWANKISNNLIFHSFSIAFAKNPIKVVIWSYVYDFLNAKEIDPGMTD